MREAEPRHVEVDYSQPSYADLAQLVEGSERVDGCTARGRRNEMLAASRLSAAAAHRAVLGVVMKDPAALSRRSR
jgi:hypothetical protein